LVLLVVGWPAPGPSHQAAEEERLATIGPAPAFTLTTQDGRRLSLDELRGKIVVVTFIYTSCPDACPLLTAKMAALQNDLGRLFGPEVFFVSISVDPERDTPEVLTRYAQAHGANLDGWAFVTGTPDEIRTVTRQYGIYTKEPAGGGGDHTFLTSLVDPRGSLRVQYMGVRFDPDELLHDLQSLLREDIKR
jgi:protein SCO1/2